MFYLLLIGIIFMNPVFGYYNDILKHQDAILFLSHPDCEICKEKLEMWKTIKEKHVEKKNNFRLCWL